LAISRDGGQVFYITADNTDTRGSLYRVSSLGGPSRKLAEPANDVGGISPDGERLLYVRYSQPSQIVSIRATDGGDEQVIRTAPAVEPESNNFRDPHFSSDGKSIFYIGYERRGTEEYWSLEQINLADGSVNVINKQQERIGEIAVLPEAAGVLVTASDPTSNLQQVFHISVTDGTKTRLTNDLFYYFGVSVDHTGQNVVVTQRADEQRVWVGETSDLANLRPLAQEPNARRYVDWTPDGHIVYDGYENNVSHIWLAEADGKNVQMLSTSENNDAEPAVSGDGRYIVFTSKRSGFQQVWRMDIDGNNQVLLANVDGGTYRPRFAADGETVIFEWNRYRESSLASVPVAGGPVREMFKTEEIPDSDNFYWAESPDGKTVAYSVWDKNENRMKIAVHPVGSPEQKKIFDIWPSLVFRWTPDSKAICYRERQRGYLPEMELHTLDVASGKTSRLLSGAPDSVMGLAYSRDGKRIALIRGRGTSNAVILTPTHQ
jgi:Tol biopolymer transport system component